MPDLISTGATTAQVAKAVYERTGEYLNKIGRQLLSVKKRLESIISEVEVAKSTFIFERQFRIPKIYVKGFWEWKDYSSSLYLYESDSGSFDIFEETELRLFSESL
ncbi:hypothetical protein N7527_005933 [Penicillium freii]|nr:hypothetical protein N7527_005933 [Penicillium freii]